MKTTGQREAELRCKPVFWPQDSVTPQVWEEPQTLCAKPLTNGVTWRRSDMVKWDPTWFRTSARCSLRVSRGDALSAEVTASKCCLSGRGNTSNKWEISRIRGIVPTGNLLADSPVSNNSLETSHPRNFPPLRSVFMSRDFFELGKKNTSLCLTVEVLKIPLWA